MAKATSINLVVITPERKVVETQTDNIVIPAHDGELGVLRDRAPLMCELGVGQLRYRAGGQWKRMMIDGGFAQINNNNVSVLTERAVTAEEVTPTVIAEAEKAAASATSQKPEALAAQARAQRRVSVLRGLKSA